MKNRNVSEGKHQAVYYIDGLAISNAFRSVDGGYPVYLRKYCRFNSILNNYIQYNKGGYLPYYEVIMQY